MASNRETDAARRYHETTKHAPASVRTRVHRLDWANKPALFKEYPETPIQPLPREIPVPEGDVLAVLAAPPPDEGDLDTATLASILYHGAGITKRARTPTDDWYYFRAAACAGALYPIELYAVTGDLEGLGAGVYHFAPLDFALRSLRGEDVRPALAAALGANVVSAPAYLVLSAIFWRSAWKYEARSYRYCFWDSGTILANLLAAATALGVPARAVVGFQDEVVDRILGVDGTHEASLVVVPLGRADGPPAQAEGLASLDLPVAPLSAERVEYPALQRIHRASRLRTPDAVREWTEPLDRADPPVAGEAFPLSSGPGPTDTLGKVIRRRGSTRRFRAEAIGLPALSAILEAGMGPLSADFLRGETESLLDPYLIVHNVEDLPSGAYHYAPSRQQLELIREGGFRREAGFVGLDQQLPALASAVVCFLADLGPVLDRLGNRGYRATQLEAGIRGGRMYLAAYGLGLGATGLTFYDDEMVEFFGRHARGKDAIFMVALGKAGRVGSRVEPIRGVAPGEAGD